MRKLYHLLLGMVILEVILQGEAFVTFLFREAPTVFHRYAIERTNWFTSRLDRAWWNKESYVLEKKTTYHPFLGFFTRNVATNHISIDTNGIRRTVGNPSGGKGLRSIYLFGGSTMMGYYAADNETIASFVAQELNRDTPRVVVTNFGQTAFVNSQELLELVLQLKQGRRPDMVIFYDGCNELSLVNEAQTGNSIFYENELQNQVNSFISSPLDGQNHTFFSKGFIDSFLDHVQIVRLMRYIVQKSVPETRESAPDRTDRMTRTMNANASVIDKLANSYGFFYALVWQPMSFTKPLTPDERKTFIVSPSVYASMQETHLKATSILVNLHNPHMYDLTHIFASDSTRSIFIDSCHVSPEGNERIAYEISTIIRKNFGW